MVTLIKKNCMLQPTACQANFGFSARVRSLQGLKIGIHLNMSACQPSDRQYPATKWQHSTNIWMSENGDWLTHQIVNWEHMGKLWWTWAFQDILGYHISRQTHIIYPGTTNLWETSPPWRLANWFCSSLGPLFLNVTPKQVIIVIIGDVDPIVYP
jgi:hypothetical protein